MTMLDLALALARIGFFVFPVVEGSKLPVIDGFQRRASRDPDQIRRWWTCPVMGTPQQYNIGISADRFLDRHGVLWALLIVDVDNKGNVRGSDSLLALELEGLFLPATYTNGTPTTGRHLIYLVPVAVKQGAHVLGPGLDIRSRGGYVLGPGSVVQAGAYAVVDDREPVPAPDWLVARCGQAVPRAPAAPVQADIDQDRALRRVVAYLEGEAPLAQEGAGGDDATYRVACRVKDLGLDEPGALAAMLDHWNDRCSPPWSPEELETKVANAYRYGQEPVGAAAPEAQFPPEETPPPEDDVLSPVRELNRQYAVCLIGGGHHVLWETTGPDGQFKLEHLTEVSFHRMLSNRPALEVGGKLQPVSKLWINHPERRTFKGICFMPGQKAPAGWYNTWRGFRVKPLAKGESPTPGAKRAVEMWLEHGLENVCKGDKKLFRWLLGYVAHMVQRPWEKPHTALVLHGGKGTGKNVWIERVCSLFGPHALITSDRRYLVGNFNGHLESLSVFVLDEAFWSGDKQIEGILKNLVTGGQHVIERKGREPYTVDNKLRLIIIGNDDWLVQASADERRWAVFSMGEGRKQDRDYFRTMCELMAAGGDRYLLRYLMDHDFSDIDVNAAPDTEHLLEQKLASLEPVQTWWLDCLQDGRIVGSDFAEDWPERISTDDLREAFRRYSRQRNIRARLPEDRIFGKHIAACCPGRRKRRKAVGGYEYLLPSLEQSRQDWEKFIGHNISWA